MFAAGVTANSPLPEVVGGTQIGEVDLHEDYIGSMLLLSRFLRYFRLRHSSNPVTRRPPMLSRLALVGTLVLGCTGAILAQHSSEPEPYTDEDAYQVYNALLSQESSRSTVVIDAETVAQFSGKESHSWGPEDCIDPRVAGEFKDAIADYNRLNRSRWLLQRSFLPRAHMKFSTPRRAKPCFRTAGGRHFISASRILAGLSRCRPSASTKTRPAPSSGSATLVEVCVAIGGSGCSRRSTVNGKRFVESSATGSRERGRKRLEVNSA
jgi:hypothetical protein